MHARAFAQRAQIGALAVHSSLWSTRCTFSHDRPRFDQTQQQQQQQSPAASHHWPSHTSTSQSASGLGGDAGETFASPGNRVKAPSYLYQSFMGDSTRFAAMQPPLSRADLTRLERESLAHVAPSRVNDHVCIVAVRALRWIADRVFRERHIHRATMLVTVAAAAPAAGSVAAYLRMFFKRRPTTAYGAGWTNGASAAATASSSSPSRSAHGGRLRHTVTPNSPVSGAPLRHSYVGELRGLLAQSECHAVHYQILAGMAEITVVERGLVLLLQVLHFAVYLALFLFYPRMGFRLMAYTAEESTVVWTQMVNDIDLGKVAELHVPQLALRYWGLEGTFSAQGALVPMVVAAKPQDVVLYHADEAKTTGSDLGSVSFTAASAGGIAKDGDGAGGAGAAAAVASSTTQTPAELGQRRSGDGGADSATPQPNAAAAAAAAAADDDAAEESAAPQNTYRVSRGGDGSETVLTLRDVVLLIRSDEMCYRDVNHEMANELDTQPGFLRRMVNRYEQR